MLECDFHIVIPMLPPTVNEMYFHIGNRRVSKPVVQQFRKLIAYHMLKKRPAGWSPKLIRAVIVLRSSRWLAKKAGSITRMDADNRIKPTLDAIEKPLGIPDQVFVDVRVVKCPDVADRTEVYLRALA